MLTVFGAVICWIVSGCSCVFYGHDEEFAYAITASHCVGDEGSAVVCDYHGKRFGCRVIGVDRDRDLAILKADKVHVGDVSCPVVSARAGDELVLVGYPGGVRHATSGVLRSFLVPGTRSHFVDGTVGVAGGISGGGVFNRDGLVGVVTHRAEMSGSSGAGCSIVDRILDRQTDKAIAKTEAAVDDATRVGFRELILLCLGWLSRYYLPGANMVKLGPVMAPSPKQ